MIFSLIFLTGGLRCIQADAEYDRALSVLEGSEHVQIHGKIYSRQEREKDVLYYVKEIEIQAVGITCQAEGYYIYSEERDLEPGSLIAAEGKPETFSPARNEGNFDGAAYYRSLGICGRMYDAQIYMTEQPSFPVRAWLSAVRERVKMTYEEVLEERDAGILASMCLGDRSLLSDETKELYQVSGIIHMLAISGMHISVLGMSVYRIFRKRFGFCMSGILAYVPVILYGIMTGASASAMRAVIMFGIYLLAQILGRTYDLLSALGAAGILLLLDQPMLMENPGFQLSFAAVLGIGIVYPIICQSLCSKEKTEGRLVKLFENVLFLVSIQITLLPVTLFYYYEASIYAVPVNLLIVPLAGILMGMGLTGGMLGMISGKAAGIMLYPCHLLLEGYDRVCNFTSGLPGAVWTPGKPKVWMMIVYYGLLVMLLIFLYRKSVSGWKRGGIKYLFLVLLMSYGLLFKARSSFFEIDVLDVGQGDGIYIRADNGTDFFIDGGSSDVKDLGKYRLKPFLKAKGVSDIEYWFVSHGDEDHISGLLWLLETGFPVEHLVLSESMPEDEALESLCKAAEQNGTDVIYLRDGDCMKAGALQFTCINVYRGDDRNDASLILLLEYGDFGALFAGDISEDVEKMLVNERRIDEVEVYKANHHGSGYSSSQMFLERIKPLLTVISCGENNRYGHPHEETLLRLENVRSGIAVTAKSGQIKLLWKKGRLHMENYADTLEEGSFSVVNYQHEKDR